MELDQLRYFVAAAEEQNITRAAERVHVTQPALSRQLARLERELGINLFERVKKRIHITDAGRFFLDRARRILCDVETSAQQVREQFGDARRVLRLGILSPFLDDIAGPALREFRKLAPRTRVSLFELRPSEQLDRLRNHELDAALLGNLDEQLRSEFHVRRLVRHPMAAVLSIEHALSTRRAIALSELAREPWISLSETFFPGRRAFLRTACLTAGFEPNIAAEADSLGLALAAVAAGDGSALLPRHCAKLPHAGAVFVALKPPTPQAELFLVRARGEAPGELESLANLLARHAAALA